MNLLVELSSLKTLRRDSTRRSFHPPSRFIIQLAAHKRDPIFSKGCWWA